MSKTLRNIIRKILSCILHIYIRIILSSQAWIQNKTLNIWYLQRSRQINSPKGTPLPKPPNNHTHDTIFSQCIRKIFTVFYLFHILSCCHRILDSLDQIHFHPKNSTHNTPEWEGKVKENRFAEIFANLFKIQNKNTTYTWAFTAVATQNSQGVPLNHLVKLTQETNKTDTPVNLVGEETGNNG